MARTATYIILAEDLAGARLVENHLVQTGVPRREVRQSVHPRGQGSGKQWVEQQYPIEVKLYRSQRNHVFKALLVVTDADEQMVAQRHAALDASLTGATPPMPSRGPDEAIVHVIPKWEIETWAEHLLRGTEVSEDVKMGWSTEKSERECAQAGKQLGRHRAAKPTCCPPSLVASDAEFARI